MLIKGVLMKMILAIGFIICFVGVVWGGNVFNEFAESLDLEAGVVGSGYAVK